MNDNIQYHEDIIKKFKNQFDNIHKKYQTLLQENKNDRLNLFINKKNEILNLMLQQSSQNHFAFSYIHNDYIKYIHKLHCKINREILKDKEE